MKERIPTPSEIASAEQTYQPGKIPEDVWFEHMRLHAVATIETTPYRIVDGHIQVFMVRRPPTDKYYPNMLHVPGTMCNGNDTSLEDAYERVREKEFPELIIDKPKFIFNLFRKTPRGSEYAAVYATRVLSGGNEENWFNTDNLPEETIPQHKTMIREALKYIQPEDYQI